MRHVLRVVRELLLYRPKGKSTRLEPVLTFLGGIQKRTAIAFLISDFLYPIEKRSLALASRHFDLISIALIDPTEKEFPDIGLVEMTDLETGQAVVVDTSSSNVQNKASDYAQKMMEEHRHLMKSVGAGFIEVFTDEPYINPLLKFFKLREKRR